MFQRLARRAKDASAPADPTARGTKAGALAATFGLVGLLLGGCAQQPQQMAAAGHAKEYFPSSIYGPASRRVIEDGQPVPRGGGQYLVGKPYTVAGQTYYPSERRVTQVGFASWYGDAFHGRLTANGEIYDRDSFTAAHPTMPLPSYARVTNLRNNTSMIVRVNDRGPYHSNRVMDVSRRVADALDIRRTGTARVKVEWVARASLAGSDDAKLAATLRTDGPARLQGVEEPVLVAAAPAPARVASLGSDYPVSRPRPIVEEQRPERLEAYRAPRAPRRDASSQDASSQDDDQENATRVISSGTLRHARHLDDAEPSARSQADDEASTGSISRHRRDAGRAEVRRDELRHDQVRHDQVRQDRANSGKADHVQALRFAEREMTRKGRDARVQSAERPAPALRHAALAPTRGLASPRASLVASVLPPVRPHAVGLRMTRSRGD